MERVSVLGVPFDNVTLFEACERAMDFLKQKRTAVVVTPNAEIVNLCRKNPIAMKCIRSADLIIPDGIGVIKAARIIGTPLKEKVAGIDLAQALMAVMAPNGYKLYLLGGAPGVAEKAAERLQQRFKGLIIAGTQHGYFNDKDEDAVVEKIAASGADVVFVCMGAPKQEIWMQKYKDRLPGKVMLGLGGSLDIFADIKKRAPKIFIDLGLEWLYRVAKEPARLRRVAGLPFFLIDAVIEKRRIKK